MSAFEQLGKIEQSAKEAQEIVVQADVMQDLESVAEAIQAIANIQDLAADALKDFARSIVPPPIYDSRIEAMTTKIDEFIRNARASCQSEARAVAECLEDALEGCDGDEHASMTQSIADEFIGWGEAMRQVAEPAVAIQTDQIELSDLAREAMPRGKDDWGSERQVAAENEFYANAKNVIAAGAWQRFEDWGLKATTKERINEAVRLAASDPAPPEPEFLDEDNGATLVCDCCGQDVRTNEAHTCRGAIPKIRKVSLRFYLTANMCDNKYTLHVTSDEFGVLRYVFTGGWGDSGMGHCLSNFGLKQPLPATVGDVSVYDLAECIQKILLGGYQKAVDVVFALEIDG